MVVGKIVGMAMMVFTAMAIKQSKASIVMDLMMDMIVVGATPKAISLKTTRQSVGGLSVI
tara:strand:+ start:4764 stop:4943 length:180 start_codon:yes stop_codon:yes gene_type:complete